MLEEGEIDEEIDPQPAIQPEQPKAQQAASTSPTTNEPEPKQSLLPTPKPPPPQQQQQHHHHHHHHSKPAPMPLLKTDSSKIPSLLSTNFENPKLKKRKNTNHNESNGNSELLNKRKKVFTKNSNFDEEIDDAEDEPNEEPDENGDKDERLSSSSNNNNSDKYFKPIKNGNGLLKTPLLATPSATPSSSWSAPKSSNTAAAAKTGPISLFDLFKNTGDNLVQSADNGAASFVDPIITEKENNKPNKFGKKMNDNYNDNNHNEEECDESEMVSTDSIKEKMEKKRKYIEITKDKQKKEQDKLEKQKEKAQNLKEKVLCHFFVEGRCQKGDKCTFSHNIALNKKYEICKFYLNGFCSKNDKCLFMHSDFPCKFYHRVNFATGQKKNQCLNGDKCRFSHEPIANPLLKEAFDKYLLESNTNESSGNNNNGPQPLLNSNGSGLKRPSLLGSPPPPSKDELPSLMDLPIKPAILPTPTLRTESKTCSPPSSPPLPPPSSLIKTNSIPFRSSLYQDVDERHQATAPTAGDIDERSAANSSPAPPINYESVKAELVTRIMKALADNDGGIFSQIPRQTLIELLVKLLNPSETAGLSAEAIITLLATLTAASSKDLARQNTNSSMTDEDKSGLNESSSNLQIDLSGSGSKKKRRISELNGSDYDSIDEDDDYGYENDLVIEGNAGDIPYRLVEIEIEPSGLWACPPVAFVNPIGADLNGDQECDPRVKYYSNKSNCNNVANFQLLLQQQQQQQEKQQQQQATPTSPSSSTQQQPAKQQQADPIQSILGANSAGKKL
jgi:hypothetical protein